MNYRDPGFAAVLPQGQNASPAAVSALRITGADAASFLHTQLTNEVNALQPGEGNLSARVTRTGSLVRYFSLHRLHSTEFVLLCDGAGAGSLLADLSKFALIEDVKLEDISAEFDWIALQGTAAAEVGERVFGTLKSAAGTTESWRDLAEFSSREFAGGPPAGSFMLTRSLAGDSGFVIAIPAEAELASEILERIRGDGTGAKLALLAEPRLSEVFETLRIEAGSVRIGVDVDEAKVVLPETGLEQFVVSYAKGCYLGQEVIARIRTYGSVPNVLRGLVLSAREDLERLPRGELREAGGAVIGRATSRTYSPTLEAPIAFAFLDRAHRTPGTRLKLLDTAGATLEAEVRLLPFYRASDTASRVAFLHDRAIRLFSKGDDATAQTLLEEALRLDPSFAEGYEALGVILGRGGKFTEAIDIFKRLEEVAPNEPMVHTNLSLFYMKLGDKVAAEEEKAKATIKQFSRFAGARKTEQVAAEELERKRADARRKRAMFEEVLEIDADDPVALFGLGNALATLEDWEASERVLARSCAVQNDNSAAFLARGKALEMLNREPEALSVYRDGMAVASKKGDLMPLKEMERRVLLIEGAARRDA